MHPTLLLSPSSLLRRLAPPAAPVAADAAASAANSARGVIRSWSVIYPANDPILGRSRDQPTVVVAVWLPVWPGTSVAVASIVTVSLGGAIPVVAV